MSTIDTLSAKNALDELRLIDRMQVSIVHPEHNLGVQIGYKGDAEKNPLNFYDPAGRERFLRLIEPLLATHHTVECVNHQANLEDPNNRTYNINQAPRLDLLHGHDDLFSEKELRAIIFRKENGYRPNTIGARIEDIIDDIYDKLETYLRLAFLSPYTTEIEPRKIQGAQTQEYLDQIVTWQSELKKAKDPDNLTNSIKHKLGYLLHHAHIGLHQFEDFYRTRKPAPDIDYLALDQQERLLKENKLVCCQWPVHTNYTFVVGALPTVHAKRSSRLVADSLEKVATLLAFPVTNDSVTR